MPSTPNLQHLAAMPLPRFEPKQTAETPLPPAGPELQAVPLPPLEVLLKDALENRLHITLSKSSQSWSAFVLRNMAIQDLEPLSIDLVGALSELTCTGIPFGQPFTRAVTLADESRVLLTTHRTMGEDDAVETVELSVMPCLERDLDHLGQIGITQVELWRRACRNPGVHIICGDAASMTSALTGYELELEDEDVVWLSTLKDLDAAEELSANVYAITHPTSDALDLANACHLAAGGAAVLLPIHGDSLDAALVHFQAAGIPLDVVGDTLRTYLLQVLVGGSESEEAQAMLTECIASADLRDLQDIVEGRRPFRSLVMDGAEKIRRGEVDDESVRALIGDDLDFFL